MRRRSEKLFSRGRNVRVASGSPRLSKCIRIRSIVSRRTCDFLYCHICRSIHFYYVKQYPFASHYYIVIAMMRRFAKTFGSSLTLTRTMAFSEIKQFENNFLNTTNLAYIESLYLNWQKDKTSVSPSFSAFFEELEHGADPEMAYMSAPAPGEAIKFMSNQSPFISQQLKLRMLI